MKKIMILLVVLIVGIASNAQSTKKEPPPPPPKPMGETVKFEPPKIIDEIVNVNKPKEPPVIKVSGRVADDFYKRNPTVSDISRQGDMITLKKKDGTIEKYDISKKEEDKSFTEKYGVSPIPPPPPPPKPKTKA